MDTSHESHHAQPRWLVPLNIRNAVATIIVLVVVLVGLRGQAQIQSVAGSTQNATAATSTGAATPGALNSLPQQVGGY